MKKGELVKKLLAAIGAVLTIIVVFNARTDHPSKKDAAADLVMFSFDRPLQLYALLESAELHLKGISEKHVIYRASDEQFDGGYEQVKQRFTRVSFHKQGTNPREDFKPLTLKATFESPSEYVIFAVDDIVVKDGVDMAHCIEALKKHEAYGFYLRLGKNLDYCYPLQRGQTVPSLQESEGIISWSFKNGFGDWAYPHTVDMTLYCKKDIEPDLRSMAYHAPNRLEDVWDRKSRERGIHQNRGLCFSSSKIVNLPLNRVQNEYKNRVMTELTPRDLLDQFLQNKKMDIEPLRCVENRSAHMEYSPTFITR